MQYSYGDTPDNIKFTEILGQYSYTTSINTGNTDGIMKLTEIAPNGVQGDFPYIYGYYNQGISTLTGTWSSVSRPDIYPKMFCVSGGFIFEFYKKNGKIGFSGTWGCGNNEYGGYNGIDYWNGTKL